jgi:hypothetical protein
MLALRIARVVMTCEFISGLPTRAARGGRLKNSAPGGRALATPPS